MSEQITMSIERFRKIVKYEAEYTGCHQYAIEAVIPAILKELLLDEIKPLFGSGWYPKPKIDSEDYTGNVKVKVNRARSLESLKDYTKAFRRIGYARGKGKIDLTTNTPEWLFGREGWPSIKLVMDFSHNKPDDETVCRYVQVGVKEVPDMKLVCPGDPLFDETHEAINVTEIAVDNEIHFVCDDCGGVGESSDSIKHHKTCKPGDSKRGERLANEAAELKSVPEEESPSQEHS